MRKVVHYAAASVPGGLLRHLVLLASRTAKHGWISEAWLHPDRALDAEAAALAASGCEIRRLTVSGKEDAAGLARLASSLLESEPDLLHVHLASPVESLPVILLAGGVGRFASRPSLVATEHAPSHHPAERAWSRAAKEAAAPVVARVIALSCSDKEYLATVFGVPRERITVVANGVEVPAEIPSQEEARRALGLPPGGIVLGYVGEIVERKGLGDLVEAMAILKRGGEAPPAILAGEGPYLPALKAAAERAGLAAQVRLPGPIRPPLDLYAACDIFVFPSHGEAMPLALLEAMAAGRPAVASRVGAIPDVVRDGVEGRLVPARDPAALAEAIASLLADEGARTRMGRAARERIREAFDVERMAEAVCALYEEVVTGEAG